MKSYNVAVIGGDGTGPEVVREAIKVLDVASKKFGLKLNYTHFDFGGDRYLRTKEILPDSAVDELRKFPVVLLGAIGHPDVKPGILEKGILLRLRFELEQYINLRPVKLYDERFCPLKDKGPKEIDFVVVRENNEGLYTGSGGFVFKGTPHEIAVQESINTRRGVERCLRYAFDYTRKRNKDKKLTLCGKTNVLTYAFDLWERAFHEIGQKDYPEITRDYAHVDATTMWFVKNPEWFDVIVTDNMFGDIITDLGAMIQGGMGIAARRQHQSTGYQHVRAHRRQRPEVHRQKRHQPARRHLRRRPDARFPWRNQSRRRHRKRRHQNRPRKIKDPRRRQNGPRHQGSRRPGRSRGVIVGSRQAANHARSSSANWPRVIFLSAIAIIAL